MMSSFLRKLLPIAAAAASVTATASATLSIDLRVAPMNGVPYYTKSICARPGAIVVIDVYAIVTGATEGPGLEGFQLGIGSIVSGTGGLLMDVLTNEFVGPFGGAGSTVGQRIDLDADGDLDIGSNATVLNSNFIGARSASMVTGNANGLGVSEFKFYTFSIQIAPDATGGLSLNWRKTDLTGLTNEYYWQEDGVTTSSHGVNGGPFRWCRSDLRLSLS